MNSIIWLTLLGMAMHLTFLPAQTENFNVSGTWDLTLKLHEATATPTIILHQEGEKITGTYDGSLGKTSLEGNITGKNIRFVVSFKFVELTLSATYSGTFDDGTMKGSVQFSAGGSGSWTAQRKKAQDAPAK